MQGAPRRAKGKTSSSTRYEVNPSLSAKSSKNTALFFVRQGRASFSRWRLGRLVCVVVCCSVGVLLRNRKPCAHSQKANKFSFCLSAQCLQLRCPPPLQPSHFGRLSTAATARIGCGEREVVVRGILNFAFLSSFYNFLHQNVAKVDFFFF